MKMETMEQMGFFFCTLWLAFSAALAQNYYNVLSATDFESFKLSTVPCAVHFITKSPDKLRKDWQMKEFITNFMDSGRYLEAFDVKFATIDCSADPVKEYCSKDTAKNTLFLFRYGHILTKLPMDALYNVDAIISNLLHLVLLREVPIIQDPMDLAAMQQRLKGRKDILFAKLIAVGTSEHRAFMEGAFAYGHLYQFTITTNMANNMLGPGTDAEWTEAQNRVWLLNCKPAATADLCQRSFFRGKLTVPDFTLYLKTLDLLPYTEYKGVGGTIFYQKLGIPTAYVYSITAEYDYHREMVQDLAQSYKGNLGFVLVDSDKTPGSVVAGSEHCQPPCLMLQRAPQEDLIPMQGDVTPQIVAAFIEDNMYVHDEQTQDQFGDHEDDIPVQQMQDDEVQYAVYGDTRVQDMPHVAKLTDKTFPEFIAGTDLVAVLFTVRWDPRCKAFLESYSNAAKTIQRDVAPDQPLSPLAQVECFNWPDVCQLNNVTVYPTIKLYREGKLVTDYKGPLSEAAMLKTYRLYSTANPVVLRTCSECLAFGNGEKPNWAVSTLNAVVIGHFPATASRARSQYEQAAKNLQGQHLMGLCLKHCTELRGGTDKSKPTVTALKWDDPHQPSVRYIGDYTAGDVIKFVHAATLPLVPELTPSTLPLHLARAKPFLLLFRDLDDQSREAEASLASLAREKTFEPVLTTLWIDVSQPSCIGSEILQDYGIKRRPLHPSIVFVDHGTSRVCNYPPDYSLKASAMADWVVIVLNGETNCSDLKEGKFEPRVIPYDFLALIQERMQRLSSDHHHDLDEEEEAYEEMRGERDGQGRRFVSDDHRHTEL